MYGQFFVLFALMFTGFFCRRIDIIDEQMNRGLNRFILYLAFPCLIVHKTASLDMGGRLLWDFLTCFALSAATFVLFCLYSFIYARLRKFPASQSNVAELCMILPNNAFMGFPITLLFFGERGLFFMLAHNVSMNLCLFSYGVYLMGRNNENREKKSASGMLKELLKLFLNPNLLALVLGFALCLLGVSIPSPVDEYLLYLGNITTPMSMVLIGSSLANSRFSEVIRSRLVVESSLNKLLVLPALAALAAAFLPVDPLMKGVIILGALFPTAAMTSMVCREYGQDSRTTDQIIFLSTVFSIATLPLGINLINGFIL